MLQYPSSFILLCSIGITIPIPLPSGWSQLDLPYSCFKPQSLSTLVEIINVNNWNLQTYAIYLLLFLFMIFSMFTKLHEPNPRIHPYTYIFDHVWYGRKGIWFTLLMWLNHANLVIMIPTICLDKKLQFVKSTISLDKMVEFSLVGDVM